MNKSLLMGGAAVLGLVVLSKKNKTKPSKISEEIEDDDIMINEENITHYFSTDPVYIKDIPSIYGELSTELQKYVNTEYVYGEDDNYSVKPIKGAFVYVNEDTAVAIWDSAIYHLLQNPNKYYHPWNSSKNPKEFSEFVNKVLKDAVPDVYWKEGLAPYTYKSPFWYVWVSAKYLIKFAKIVALKEDWITAPGNIEDDS